MRSSQKQWIGMISLVLLATFPLCPKASEHEGNFISSKDALQILKSGNDRFVEGKRTYPHQDATRVQEMTQGQHPFVTIISCSDSRVPPEHLFDVGMGDIFSVRVAGNVCDIDEIGSIEYGVDHLQTPLLVILGHSRCGAVTAVVQKAAVHGKIPELVDNIFPAVEKTHHEHPELTEEEQIVESIQNNVWQSIEDLLRNSEIVRERVESGKLQIMGALYHLENGQVEWLGAHPREQEILSEHHSQSEKPRFVHNVYFYLNENASEDQKQQLIADCKTLLGSVKTVRNLTVGLPAGTPREVVDNTYGVHLMVQFDDKAGHDFYQTAEEHLQFIERNKNTWKRVQIYDSLLQ